MIVVGVDVGRESHRFVVVNAEKQVLERGSLLNVSRDIGAWCKRLHRTYASANLIQAGVETSGGLSNALEGHMQAAGWQVRQVLPDRVKTYRESVLRLHNKTDDTDAYTIAMLLAEAPEQSREVRRSRANLCGLTRHRGRLIDEQTMLLNQLRKAIAGYWPDATRELFPCLTNAYILALFAQAPDPAQIALLGVDGLAEMFRKEKSTVSRDRVVQIVELAERSIQPIDDTDVLTLEASHAARSLQLVRQLLKETEQKIEALGKQDPDVEMLRSKMRGVSMLLAASVVGEMQTVDRFEKETNLASYGGLALRRNQTGRTKNTLLPQRRANDHLRETMLTIAGAMVLNDERSRAYYQKKTQQDKKTHRQALRALARHVIRRIYRLMKSRP